MVSQHNKKPLLIRITTVPVSMQLLLKGQMKFMQQQGFKVTMISSDGAEVEAVQKQEECELIKVPFTRTISPFTDLLCLIKLFSIFRRLKPQIVHTHTPKAGLIGMLAARLAGVPVRLHTIAGLPWMETTGRLRWLLKLIEKLTAAAASRIYPNSNALKIFLEENDIARDKMKVLGKGSSNGINSTFFSETPEIESQAMALRAQKNVAADAWVWIFVGRLVKDKGLGELLDAFEVVQQQFTNDQLWLLGVEEPELDPLDERHKKMLHAHKNIHCWGFQKDIRPYLSAAQVLTFPSYREGFPNVPMQAALMGCMLILSDINGCNEIVQHNENGMLVPVKDTAGLQQAMMNARLHPDMKEQFAAAIRKKIIADYDQQKLWSLILAEYDDWLTKKGLSR